jgi:hypothetical protein
MANNNLLYGVVIVVAILVFVGAAIAVGFLTPTKYDVSLSFAANNSAASIYPYQTSLFNITVTNQGSSEVVGLPIAFYINGNQKNYTRYAIPAHQSVSIQEKYIYPSAGQYLFTASVDPGNFIDLANRSSARKSILITAATPAVVNVYSSVPNSNIVYTDSFTSSGTGLLSGSLMASLYNISALVGMTGADNSILGKSYQDLQPYTSVANGAYSIYANGTATYAAWLQGTLTPKDLAAVIGSFGKKIGPVNSSVGSVEFSALTNSISLCSYYQGGWTKIVEVANNSTGETCLALVGNNYSGSENNAIITALKGTRIGTTTSNQVNASGQIPWQKFYYNNATVLGQTLEYGRNAIAASTLFQLQTPAGIFLSSIKGVYTNLSNVNDTCFGLAGRINNTNVCSVVLPTTTQVGNITYGAVRSELVTANYTATIYSLISESYFTLAHQNALELISQLKIPGNSIVWQSPFRNSCAFESGFGCRFNGQGPNGTVNITITNLNYSSVQLDNVTCVLGQMVAASPLNGTLARNGSVDVDVACHSAPIPIAAAETSLNLDLGFSYKNTPMIVNGTLNLTSGG